MVVDQFEVPRQQIISDLGGKHRAGHCQEPSRPSPWAELLMGHLMPCRAQPERGGLHPHAAEGHDLRGAGRSGGQGWRYGREHLSPVPVPVPVPKPGRRARAAKQEQRELALGFLFKTYRPRCTIYRSSSGRRWRWPRRRQSWSRRCGSGGAAWWSCWTTHAAPPVPASWAGHGACSWALTTARWDECPSPAVTSAPPVAAGLMACFFHPQGAVGGEGFEGSGWAAPK